MLKLLLDENLSPAVAVALRREGYDVIHVRERGMLGNSDPEVLERAFREDRILVTANVSDFLKLTSAREIHAGIVLLDDGGLVREEQLQVIHRALVWLALEPDTVNLALRVSIDGEFTVEEIPGGGDRQARPRP